MTLNVREWLESGGFGQYAEVFEANEIGFEDLPALTDEHLKELGIAIGPRVRLLKSIRELSCTDAPSTGTDAAAPAAAAAEPLATAEAERRQLTVMFVDLVGSTALSSRLDPEDLREIIRSYQAVVAEQVTAFGGHVAQYLGDGVLAYFGYPVAHEDEAERAVRAALAILSGVGAKRSKTGEPLAGRIGIATGLVVVGDLLGEAGAKEHAVVGETPNLAARLQGLAAPGQVVVSSRTQELIGHLFELQSLGPQNVKGIAVPVAPYVVVRDGAVESRFEARTGGKLGAMVGRDGELRLLTERWRMAAEGDGQLAILIGDAGIGKSRIVRALQDTLAAEPHVRINYQCSPYHSDSALFPVIQQLSRTADLASASSVDEKLDRLEGLFGGTAPKSPEDCALLAGLLAIDGTARYGRLGLSPQQQRQRTFELLSSLSIALSRERPVLIVLEDAHWVDPSTLELFDVATERLASSPIMMLITARPGVDLEFGGRCNPTRIMLNRLGRSQIEAVVRRVAGGKAMPEGLLNEIAAKTDGVPLFAEEITKTMLESGLLQETDDAFVFDRSRERLVVPVTLHDSLMARLDRLQPVKEVAQAAACIGRDFEYALLRAILPIGDSELREALSQLARAELVFGRGSPPHSRFTFKHALVRDAAYESLLRSRRQDIHGRLTAAMEAMPEAEPELLAHHATQGGLTEKAIEFWQKAAAHSVARPAYKEAIAHLNQAIRLAEQMGESQPWLERRLNLLLALGRAYIPLCGYGHAQTVATFTRAQELAGTMQNVPQRLPIAYAVWSAHYTRGEQDKALETARHMVAWAESDGHAGAMLTAVRSLAVSQMISGAPALAEETFEQAHQLAQTAGERSQAQRVAVAQRYAADPDIASQFYVALATWANGRIGHSRRLAADALAAARAMGHAHTLGHALAHASIHATLCRDAAQALALSAETIAFSEKHDLAMWKGYGSLLNAFTLALAGDAAKSVPIMESGFNYMERTQTGAMVQVHRAMHACTLAALGRFEEAARNADMVRRELESGSERYFWPESQRLLGDYLRRCPNVRSSDVEGAYHRALEHAREQKSKSWELYAALSLARYRADRGERREAAELLAPVHAGLAGAGELSAYHEASALLAELGRAQ